MDYRKLYQAMHDHYLLENSMKLKWLVNYYFAQLQQTEKNTKFIYIAVSGTYKLKKLDLQRDGYDIERIKDQVYYSNKGIYQELTIEAYTDIMSGKIRL